VPDASILKTIDLTKSFGMVMAANQVNVEIHAGELVGIVGANGSGKTTFLNLITGYLTPDRGRIFLMGEDRTGLPPRVVTRLGIARSFQIPQLYTNLSVLDSILLSVAARAQLMVVGRRARRTAVGARIGSVTHGVLHHAECPVAVVPHE